MPKLRTLLPTRETLRVNRVRIATLACMALPIIALGVLTIVAPRDLAVPNDSQSFWALVQALAGVTLVSIYVGLAIIAWYGLRSIGLARQDMTTRAIRESRTLAMARAKEFSAMIRGEHKAIQNELATSGIQLFTHQLQSGAQVFDGLTMYPAAKEWWDKVPAVTRSRITYFLNDLEAWSMYFTKELADSDVIRGPCAPTYCSMVLQYSAWILVARKERYYGFYPNIVGLFHSWRAELDAEEGGLNTEAALRAANAAEQRLAKLRVPPPLGTKVDI